MDFRADPLFGDIAGSLEESRGLPKGLLASLVHAESRGNPNAVSPVGARGLVQFMPDMVKKYNVNMDDPADQLRGGADYLQDLTHQYGGNLQAAVSHYNGGGNQAKFYTEGTPPPTSKVSPANFAINQKYVKDVLGGVSQAAPAAAPKAANDLVGQVNSFVTGLAKNGGDTNSIIAQLMANPTTAGLVKQGREAGDSMDQIVSNLGGPGTASIISARAKIDGQNIVQNAIQGGTAAGADMFHGGQQLVARATGDDAGLARQQAEEAARQADPERQALNNTAGGMIGGGVVKAAPAIAAGLATGGAALPVIAGQALAGAASGALVPTTDEGQIAKNIATEALIGGGTAGAVKGAGALVSKVGSVPAEEAARRATLIADAQAKGLPVSASNVSPFWKGAVSPKSAAAEALQGDADKVLASKVADGLGVTGHTGPIDSALLQQAEPGIKAALDNVSNINLTLPKSIGTDFQQFITGSTNPLTKGIAENSIVKQAAGNLIEAANSGTAISGQQLQALNSELKALVQNQAASASEKQMAGQMVGKINKLMTDAMTPEQGAAYTLANKQYGNLKAVEKMVVSSNDTGVVSPRQMLQAVKNGRFRSAFLDGEAPYQDLASTASELYGPAGNGRGLGNVIRKSVGSGDSLLGGVSVLNPHVGIPAYIGKKAAEALLNKLGTSQNATVVRLLTGAKAKGSVDAVTRSYIAKALGAAAPQTD